jgi:hypothetical protein
METNMAQKLLPNPSPTIIGRYAHLNRLVDREVISPGGMPGTVLGIWTDDQGCPLLLLAHPDGSLAWHDIVTCKLVLPVGRGNGFKPAAITPRTTKPKNAVRDSGSEVEHIATDDFDS